MDTARFLQEAQKNLQRFLPADDWDEAVWDSFRERLHYVQLDADETKHYAALATLLEQGETTGRLFYLATLPSLYGEICQQLQTAGAVTAASRVVLEKPLGHDLASCRAINEQVAAVFDEEATFRIDHYLGKETVQNLLALRFGNPLFHPMWNNTFINSVQITVAEEIGVAGRGSYYADTGALRDMVQNHLLQVLSLVAMEPPSSLRATDIRDEKMKVLRCLEPITLGNVKERTVRGRYSAGAVSGKAVKGFLEEDAFHDADGLHGIDPEDDCSDQRDNYGAAAHTAGPAARHPSAATAGADAYLVCIERIEPPLLSPNRPVR